MPFFRRCARCRQMIAFVGEWSDGEPFCDSVCAQKHTVNKRLVAKISAEELMSRVEFERNQNCLHCGVPGPIDMYPTIVSINFMIAVSTTERSYVCCRKCGVRFQEKAINRTLLTCIFISPHGWLISAITIMRNHRQIKKSKEPGASKMFVDYVKAMMCEEMSDWRPKELPDDL